MFGKTFGKVKTKIIAFVLILSLVIPTFIMSPGLLTTTYASATYETPNPNETQWDCASKIYSVFKAIGWNDYQIAGALGNMWMEGGFDYTAVETIYDEPFQWGPKKQYAESVDFDTTKVPSFVSAYNNADGHNNITKTGLGLIGFSDIKGGSESAGGINNTKLREYAASYGTTFYASIDIQLQFLIDEENGYSGAKNIRNWTEYTYDPYNHRDFSDFNSIASTTAWFCWYIEGWYGYEDLKRQYAEWWYSNMSSLYYDQSYAQGILSLSGYTGSISADFENPYFDGWDLVSNQETASYVYSMSDWNYYMSDLGFLYNIGDGNFATLNVPESFLNMPIDDTGLTLEEYCEENFSGEANAVSTDSVKNYGGSERNFGYLGPLVIACAYTLQQKGLSYYTLNSDLDEHKTEDIAYTEIFLANTLESVSVSSQADSLDNVYNALYACVSAYNQNAASPAFLYVNDEYLGVIVQGLVYGTSYVRYCAEHGLSYSPEEAEHYEVSQFSFKIKQSAKGAYEFAQEALSYYTTVSFGNNVIYG